MDFVEGLPRSEGKDTVLVVVDKLTKSCHLMSLTHPFTATQVAQLVLDTVVKLHGPPKAIISDRDKIFVSSFWKELFKAMGTQVKLSTAYHPQTDGQTERVNQCIEMYLRCMISNKPSQWHRWLPMAEWWYNTTFHSATGMTPFKALYGINPPIINYHPEGPSNNPLVVDFMKEREATQQLLKERLQKAQERMKFYADKKRTEREFEIGDEVYLKLQPYRQMSVALRRNFKLSTKYFGHYPVVKRVGKVAYKLQLPPNAKVHDVFHVSQLKKKIGQAKVVQTELPQTNKEGELRPVPIAVLDRRLVKKGNRPATMVLIQWSHSIPEDATWEEWGKITEQFPEFNPWGQGSSQAVGNCQGSGAGEI